MSSEPEAPPAPTKVQQIIVIKRKVVGHGGHHGGAWKVAYADFVTAMMALFIVLWLMSADKEVQQAVSAYFNNPTGPGKQTGTAVAGAGNAIQLPKDDMAKLAQKIQEALLKVPDFRTLKDHVEITITSGTPMLALSGPGAKADVLIPPTTCLRRAMSRVKFCAIWSAPVKFTTANRSE